MMIRYTLLAALVLGGIQAQTALAQPGAAPLDTSLATYDTLTGEIIVSINNVNNWFVNSAAGNLNGDEPVFTSIVPGSFLSNDDNLIGETGFTQSIGTDVSLGNVAATGVDISDFTISWNAGLGGQTQTGDVTPAGGDVGIAPTAAINGPFVINIFNGDPLNILLDASGSTGDPTLSYDWDLDGSNTFGTVGPANGMLAIADVTATFGGLGSYPVSVRVTNSSGSDIAGTSVQLVPEPGSLVLACLGLIGIASTRRRRNS